MMFVPREYRCLVVVVLCLALTACVAGAAPPTPAPTAGDTPSAVSGTALPAAVVPLSTQATAASGPTASPQTGSDQEMAAAVTWLRQNAVPLQAARSTAGLDDLLALKPLIGQARIVAVGQSAYGARAFVEMQQRVVKFAVLQMGFNVIAADVDVADASAIDAYIHSGDEQPLSPYVPVDWRSQEMFDLTAWMRDFNQHHPAAAQLRLVGIGARPPWPAIQWIENYLHKVDLAEYETVASGYACLTRFESSPEDYAQQEPMTQVECWTQLKTIYETLQAKRDVYVRVSDEVQYQEALANAEAVREGEEVLAGGEAVRHQMMAEHVRRLLAQAAPDSRVLLLAHNDFIGSRTSPYKTMGALLRDQFGGQYVSMALDAELGRFTSFPSPNVIPDYYAAPLPPADSYERFFELANLGAMLVPLRPTSAASVMPAWLASPHPFRSIGEKYDPTLADQVFYRANLPAEFDALLYVHDTCPAAPGYFIYEQPADTDFEDPCGTAWQISSDQFGGYQSDPDVKVAHGGKSSLSLQSMTAAPQGAGWVGQMIRAGLYQGQRVRLTAYIKTQNVVGLAGLAFVAGKMQSLPAATQEAKLLTGSQEWQQTSIELDVPSTADVISYGVVLRGAGKLWLDELRLEILPAAKPAPAPPSSLATPTAIPASVNHSQRVGGLVPLAAGKLNLLGGLAIFRMYSAAGPFSVVLQDSGRVSARAHLRRGWQL